MRHPAPLPANEDERLERLRALAILDTAPEAPFDTLARLASSICGTPIALVSLVDHARQWFKANVGLPGVSETPRELAFCAHAILEGELLEVPDAQADPRFTANPLVTGEPGIRFYAGAPIELAGGVRLGTLCVIDRAPRALSDAQRTQLCELARAVAEVLALRERALAAALAARSRHEADLTGHLRSLSTVLDLLPAAVSVWSRDLSNVYANAELARWLGTTPEALVGRTMESLIGPERMAEREAATLSRLMTAIVDGSSDAIFGQNLAGQVTSWNAAAEALLGWKREEIVGQPAWKLFSKGALAMAAMDGEQGTLSSFETHCRHKDGRDVVVAASLSPIRDQRGRVLGISAILRDIGPLRDALAALRESEAFLDRTGRVARIGGWEYEPASGRIRWSPQLRRILEVPPGPEPALDGALAFYPEPGRGALVAAIDAATRHGQPFDLELPLVTAKGRAIWVRAIGEAVREDGRADGPVTRLAGALQDISDDISRRAELERERGLRRLLEQRRGGAPAD